jgi:5'-nucleotidase
MRLRLALAAALACALAGAPAALAKDDHGHHGNRHHGHHGHHGRTVAVQLVGINDFHGNLEPPGGLVNGQAAGGIEYLATHVKALEARNPRRTVVVSAGDLIGASPLLSALFHDEPTIEAMNKLGLDINSVGNHEFDEGADELLRMQNGGCRSDDPRPDCDFGGARFRFLSANVVRESNGRTLFPPYVIKRFDGVKVAFIGETLEGTPQIVTPSGVAGLQFRDEADTINALVPRLRRQGVKTIVALIHEGGVPVADGSCVSGPIRDIVERTSREVDVFMTGHTHQIYNCVVDGRPVTSAGSFGKLLTDVDMTIDRRSGQPTTIKADNLVVTRDVAKDPAQTELIDHYKALAGPIGDRVIGNAAADITRDPTPAGETALGDVIADSQLEATRPAGFGGAQIAFMNPGGIRADLAAGPVTFAEAFTVQPFGNSLVTMTLTGAQIERVLEQQVFPSDTPNGSGTVLQVSNGFHYTWDPTRPAGDRIDPASITLNGLPLVPTQSYRVTVNSFLADGGDGFTVLREGTDRLGGAIDLDALEAYFAAHSPVAPGARDRIARAGA